MLIRTLITEKFAILYEMQTRCNFRQNELSVWNTNIKHIILNYCIHLYKDLI